MGGMVRLVQTVIKETTVCTEFESLITPLNILFKVSFRSSDISESREVVIIMSYKHH